MDRRRGPELPRIAVSVALLLLAAGVVAAVRLAPPVPLAPPGLGWIDVGLAAALLVAAGVAALRSLIVSLRTWELAGLMAAGASAALAGGAIGAVVGASLAIPLLGCASLLAGSALLGDLRAPNPRAARLIAVGIMVAAEAVVVVGLLPVPGAVTTVVGWLAAAVAGSLALARIGGLSGWSTGLVAVGALALALDRGGALESTLGMAALVAAQLLTVATWWRTAAEGAEEAERMLPDLASRLAEPILHFDGGLRLRDWNQAAAELLGLDATSAGSRAEDLLGVTIAELPIDGDAVISRGGVGGLEIAMHRSGSGLVAVVRDPGAGTEAERLGMELRTTIEELLRARRTIELQRGELERASTVDPLTGVSSRGAILERIRMEVAQARRYRHPLAVVLLDVDRFGEVNTAHGIGGGDAVLREVALRFRLRVREADALGRSGSDGFLAVLPHTDEAGAATFADALRHRLRQRPVRVGENEVPVTVSIGVATMRPGEDLDVDGLLARVDEALDSARRAGGDRIALDRQHGLARLEDPHDADRPADTDAV